MTEKGLAQVEVGFHDAADDAFVHACGRGGGEEGKEREEGGVEGSGENE